MDHTPRNTVWVFLFILATGLCAGALRAQTGPTLEVTPNEFPASVTCRRLTIYMAGCNEERYATFTLTYSEGGSQQEASLPKKHSVACRVSFGYKYQDVYRTEPSYSKNYAWPEPQTTDPTLPNYVTAILSDPGESQTGGEIHYAMDATYKSGQRQLYFSTSKPVSPGAVVEVTFGDRTGGSPGYLIPALAYDIDMVVEVDNGGGFELVDAPMPVLRTIGVELNSFEVVAPSTPESDTFDIVVQALQGYEEPKINMYLVPNYTGTIHFASTDPEAVLPGDYTFQTPDQGSKRFTVTLPSAGVHTISVTEVGSSISARSNPVAVGREFDDVTKPLFWGALQQHTNIGGHAAQTEQYAFEYAIDVSLLDFLSLTEHCKADFDFEYTDSVAESYYQPGEFVTFSAIEWSNRELGHRHIVYRNGANVLPPCSNPRTEKYTYVTQLDELFAMSRGKPELIIIHHTAWKYGTPFQPTDDVVLGDAGNPNQRLFEIYSHHGSSERWDNAPYVQHSNIQHQWPPDKKVYFQDALALGYRFGVTAGTDNHMGKPGGHLAPRDHYARQGLTAVYADELTRESLWEALWARRTYGTTGARIILDFRIDGHPMGEEFVTDEVPTLTASVIGTDTLDVVQVQRDGYDTVFELSPDSPNASFEYTDDTFARGEQHNYYVRVVQRDDHIAWSSPIWVTRDEEAPPVISAFSVLAYPNPFNPTVTIRFSVPKRTSVTVEVISVSGANITTILRNRAYDPGSHETQWDGLTKAGVPAASGIYFVRVITELGTQTSRAVLVR